MSRPEREGANCPNPQGGVPVLMIVIIFFLAGLLRVNPGPMVANDQGFMPLPEIEYINAHKDLLDPRHLGKFSATISHHQFFIPFSLAFCCSCNSEMIGCCLC